MVIAQKRRRMKMLWSSSARTRRRLSHHGLLRLTDLFQHPAIAYTAITKLFFARSYWSYTNIYLHSFQTWVVLRILSPYMCGWNFGGMNLYKNAAHVSQETLPATVRPPTRRWIWRIRGDAAANAALPRNLTLSARNHGDIYWRWERRVHSNFTREQSFAVLKKRADFRFNVFLNLKSGLC